MLGTADPLPHPDRQHGLRATDDFWVRDRFQSGFRVRMEDEGRERTAGGAVGAGDDGDAGRGGVAHGHQECRLREALRAGCCARLQAAQHRSVTTATVCRLRLGWEVQHPSRLVSRTDFAASRSGSVPGRLRDEVPSLSNMSKTCSSARRGTGA